MTGTSPMRAENGIPCSLVPRESQTNVSGTLFDTTYLNYQIAERQRLRQLVAEVFVAKGLEEALNIDRESFNTAHPHYQILVNWVHNALRQVSNKQKSLESVARTKRNSAAASIKRTAVQDVAAQELAKILGDEDDTIREVCFTDDPAVKETAEREGKRVFPKNIVIGPLAGSLERIGSKTGEKVILAEEKAISIAKILDAFDLLDQLSPDHGKDVSGGGVPAQRCEVPSAGSPKQNSVPVDCCGPRKRASGRTTLPVPT